MWELTPSLTHCRTPSINAQCRSKSWQWSQCRLVHCRSILINFRQFRSMPFNRINARSSRIVPALIGIGRHWSAQYCYVPNCIRLPFNCWFFIPFPSITGLMSDTYAIPLVIRTSLTCLLLIKMTIILQRGNSLIIPSHSTSILPSITNALLHSAKNTLLFTVYVKTLEVTSPYISWVICMILQSCNLDFLHLLLIFLWAL